MNNFFLLCELVLIWSLHARASSAAQCGKKAGGDTAAHCGTSCQIQRNSSRGVSVVIDETVFDDILPNRDSPFCEKPGFYTFDSFVEAAEEFPDFGNTGDIKMRKWEVAAFLAQTAYLTSGGRRGRRDPYSWGYCYVTETGGSYEPAFDYCDRRYIRQYPCAKGHKYYGRGPVQLKWNYNYGEAAEDLGIKEILTNPDLVEEHPTISFKTAISAWMKQRPEYQMPSAHDVATYWSPSVQDAFHKRMRGFATITNIMDGAASCGRGHNIRDTDHIWFFQRACEALGIPAGENLSCAEQTPYVYEWLNNEQHSKSTTM